MYAYYIMNYARRRPRYYEESVCGLPLLRVELPRRWNGRRVGAVLRRAGVRCALNLPEDGTILPEPLLVSTRSLWQRVAAELALAELTRRGIPWGEATVGVLAGRTTKEVWDTLERLSGRVRALSLNLPEGERVALCLQRDSGVPVLAGPGDVTLCFSPAEPGKGRLLLGAERPAPEGFTLAVPGVPVPEGCPAEGLYGALEQRGRLPGRPEVCVRDGTALRYRRFSLPQSHS
ncbi:MAG: hypothetical protein LUE61_06890 [Clostridiales bacterium]|nr:hypothetical protein [Clostridiales bacterium]